MKYLLLTMLAVTAFMGYLAILVYVADFADSVYRAGHFLLSAVIGVNALLLWAGVPFVIWIKAMYRRYPPTGK